MDSVWIDTVERPRFEALEKDIKTDVLIIGGGIAGILCAYMLKQAGIDYVLAEAGEICGGITKNTTAKITAQHGLIYDTLICRFGATSAKMYLEANQKALERYRAMCQTIDCDFEDEDAFVYSMDDRKKIEKELKAYQTLGISSDIILKPNLPFSIAGAVCFENQAHFHPLKFLYAVARDLHIFENTKILELTPEGAVTKNRTIKAEKIIVATHFPFLNKHGSYFLKLYQHRSYVMGFRNAVQLDGMYVDEDEKGMSFRNYRDILLIGGGSHRTGKKGGNWNELADFSGRHYPHA